MPITRLFLATIKHHNVWLLWLVLAIVVPVVFPYMTPKEQDPTIFEPARAQAAWLILGFTALSWGLFQGAAFGDTLAIHGLGEYFASQGVSRLSQLCQTWLASFVAILPMLAVAMVSCLVWAMPGAEVEKASWIRLVFQFAMLFALVFACLLFLAIGLATRMGLAGAYVVTVSLALHGLYGVGILKLFTDVHANSLMEIFWTFSPHYHLGDLTRRLVFKLGHMPATDFLNVVYYLVGLLAIHFTLACLAFKPRRA